LLIIISNIFVVAVAGRMLIGLGGSFTFLGALYVSRTWLSASIFPLLIAVTELIGHTGQVIFLYMFSFLKGYMAWEYILLWVAIFLFVLSFLIHFSKSNSPKKSKLNSYDLFKKAVNNKITLLLALNVGCMYSHLPVIAFTWGVVFIQSAVVVSGNVATLMNSLVIIGFILGMLLVAFLARYISKLKLILYCATLELILVVLAIYCVTNYYVSIVLFFSLGVATAGVILNFSLLKEIVHKDIYSTSSGIVNMFFGLSGIILIPIVGYLFSVFQNQGIAFIPIVIAIFMSVLICIKLNFKKEYAEKFVLS